MVVGPFLPPRSRLPLIAWHTKSPPKALGLEAPIICEQLLHRIEIFTKGKRIFIELITNPKYIL
jgi:hypothetical protein